MGKSEAVGPKCVQKIFEQAGLHTHSQLILQNLGILWFKYSESRTVNITHHFLSPEK